MRGRELGMRPGELAVVKTLARVVRRLSPASKRWLLTRLVTLECRFEWDEVGPRLRGGAEA